MPFDSDGCDGHLINLTGKDSVKAIPEIKPVEEKMNGTIKFVHTSNNGKEFFEECQKLAGYESKCILLT